MTEYLFAYGLLQRRYSSNPAYNVPKMPLKWIGKGWLSGHLYKINHYPGAVHLSQSKEKICGEIYQIRDIPFFFKKMDIYEMSKPHFGAFHEYERRKRQVHIKGSMTLKCWVYEYASSICHKNRIKSGQF